MSKKSESKKCKKCHEEPVTHKQLGLGKTCYLERRTAQTARNAKKWLERLKAGKAGHKSFYRGKPTRWALKNQAAVRRQISKLSDARKAKKLGAALEKAAAAAAMKKAV